MPVLEFKGKSAVVNHHYTVPHHRLELVSELSCLGRKEAPALDGNLIVEGDNLLALKALLPTHAGRVKCVYIDPPYNTGNEGWIYNDNLTQPQFKEWIGKTVGKESEDACRHDKWCCMMYPRLQLLRELMRDDGAIFVSIDDNELHHLRSMMDEVFGAECFVATVCWRTRNTDNRVKSMMSVDHEYVVVYSRAGGPLRGRVIDRSGFSNPDGDSRADYVTDPLTGKATAAERPNLHFTITNPETGDAFPPDTARGWITDRAGIDALLEDRRIWWPPNPLSGKPRKKRFLSETSERMPAGTFWADLKGQSGADEVDQILGERLFAFPKALEFLERVIDLGAGPDDVVLDCTAGSGTTAHAVLAANARDRGARRFVLVQQPHDSRENESAGLNICKAITSERVRRVIEGYVPATAKGKPKHVPGLGGSFTYARLGPQLLTDLRDFGATYPPYDELAKYVFYTETSRQFDPNGVDRATGRIGTVGRTDYFLLYDADPKVDVALDMAWLKNIAPVAKKRGLVVYCEKFWFHRDDLTLFEKENACTVRPMLVPFQLR